LIKLNKKFDFTDKVTAPRQAAGGRWISLRLSIKLATLLLFVQCVLVAGTGYIIYDRTRSELRADFAAQIETNACAVGLDAPHLSSSDDITIKKYLETRLEFFKLSFITLVDHGTKRSWFAGDPKLAAELESREFNTTSGPSQAKKENVFVTFCGVHGQLDAEIIVGSSYTRIADLENSVAKIFSFSFIIQLLTILGLAAFIGIYVHRRISPILFACQQIAKGELNVSIKDSNHDEISIIAQNIISMSSQLSEHQSKVISQSKFVALGEMAGGVAHEINNPLSIIGNKAELLKKYALKDDPDLKNRVIKDADKIVATTFRIAKIVRGLLAFSRDYSATDLQLTSIKTVIDDALSFCTERFHSNDVKLLISGPMDISIEVIPTQLSQVLLNLFNNSYYAIYGKSDSWIKINLSHNQETLVIDIIDSGHGIPEDVANKMMQPFFTTKPVGEGTGLGLSISKGMIESFGGKLDYVRDQANTTFRMTLPIAKSDPLTNKPAA